MRRFGFGQEMNGRKKPVEIPRYVYYVKSSLNLVSADILPFVGWHISTLQAESMYVNSTYEFWHKNRSE